MKDLHVGATRVVQVEPTTACVHLPPSLETRMRLLAAGGEEVCFVRPFIGRDIARAEQSAKPGRKGVNRASVRANRGSSGCAEWVLDKNVGLRDAIVRSNVRVLLLLWTDPVPRVASCYYVYRTSYLVHEVICLPTLVLQ